MEERRRALDGKWYTKVEFLSYFGRLEAWEAAAQSSLPSSSPASSSSSSPSAGHPASDSASRLDAEEPQDAPRERRKAADGNWYSRAEFLSFFGGSKEWDNAVREVIEEKAAQVEFELVDDDALWPPCGELVSPAQKSFVAPPDPPHDEKRRAPDGKWYTKREFLLYFNGQLKEWEAADPYNNPALKPANLEIDQSYAGPRLDGDGKVTVEFMDAMLDHFKDEGRLPKKTVLQLILQAQAVLREEATVVDVPVPEGTRVTVCGDVHGQFYDLLNIFWLNGKPSEENPYLFNGDFVDRGAFSVEVILTLFGYKALYPAAMHLNRGNHESASANSIYGFEGEVVAKIGPDIMPLFTDVFQWLPLAHVIGGKVLVVHGGLFSEDRTRLDDIRRIDRHCEPPEMGVMAELLWSDPQPMLGRRPSVRGCGVMFGPDVTERFLNAEGLELLIRSHECKDEGYEVTHDGKTVTVFSAPNYCDQVGNEGCFIHLRHDCKPKYNKFSAVEHPASKPMQYMDIMSLLQMQGYAQ